MEATSSRGTENNGSRASSLNTIGRVTSQEVSNIVQVLTHQMFLQVVH